MSDPRTIRRLKKLQRDLAKQLDHFILKQYGRPSQVQKILYHLIDYIEQQYLRDSDGVPLPETPRDPRHVANSQPSPTPNPIPVCPKCKTPLLRSLFPDPFPDAPVLPTNEGNEGDPLPPGKPAPKRKGFFRA